MNYMKLIHLKKLKIETCEIILLQEQLFIYTF